MKKLILFLLICTNTCFGQDIHSVLTMQIPFADGFYDVYGSQIEVIGNPQIVEDRFGTPNCAVYFGPGNNALKIKGNNLNNLNDNNPFSVGLWFKLSQEDVLDFGDYQHLYTKDTIEDNPFFMNLYDVQTPLVGNNSNIHLWDDAWNTNQGLWTDTTNWHHLVVTVNANHFICLYRDGVLANMNFVDFFSVGSDILDYVIGKDFYGSMDDIRVYQRTLTTLDVEALYNYQGDCTAQPVCQLTNLTADSVICQSDSTYSAIVDFNYFNPTSYDFNLYFDTIFYGVISANDLPITIEDIPLGLFDYTTISVCVVDNDSCCVSSEFMTPDCNPASTCAIWDVNAADHSCMNDSFLIDISFNYIDVGNNGFILAGNGMNYGTYSYLDVPLTIGPLAADNTFYEFVITDVDNPDCNNYIDYGTVSCDTGTCELSNITMDFVECLSDSTFRGIINVDFQNPTDDHFDLFLDNTFFGFYAFADLPINIGALPIGNFDQTTISICVNDNANCCADAEFPTPVCDSSSSCSIWDLIVEEICDNDSFIVDIDFNYSDVGNNGFKIVGNGNNYGTFDYNNLPITLGPFPANNLDYEFIVMDIDNQDCMDVFELGIVDCDTTTCELSNITMDFVECLSDSTFRGIINVDVQNPTDDHFDLFFDNTFFGFYAFADLPINIGALPIGNFDQTTISICVNDNVNCCADAEFTTPVCDSSSSCSISDLIVEEFCDNDSFSVDIDFNYSDVGNNGFKIVGNGNIYGTFDYSNLPITLGPFPANNLDYEFIVMDIDNSDCMDVFELGIVDCDSSQCLLLDLFIDFEECTSDSTFRAHIDFDYQNTNQSHFDLFIDNTFFGFHAFTDLPLNIGDFPVNDLDSTYFQVCVNDNADCCTSASISTPECFSAIDDIKNHISFKYISNNIIEFQTIEAMSVGIYNTNGQTLLQSTFSELKQLDLNFLNQGLYLIEIRTENGNEVIKFIKY